MMSSFIAICCNNSVNVPIICICARICNPQLSHHQILLILNIHIRISLHNNFCRSSSCLKLNPSPQIQFLLSPSVKKWPVRNSQIISVLLIGKRQSTFFDNLTGYSSDEQRAFKKRINLGENISCKYSYFKEKVLQTWSCFSANGGTCRRTSFPSPGKLNSWSWTCM